MRTAMRQMVGVFARLDRGMTVATLRRGRRIKGEKGEYVYGAPPYGWQAHKRDLTPEEMEQAADRPHMPTDEYTELSRRIDELDDVLDTLLRLLGQAGSLHRARPGGDIRVALAQEAPTAAAGYGEVDHVALLHRLVQEAEFVPPDLSQ